MGKLKKSKSSSNSGSLKRKDARKPGVHALVLESGDQAALIPDLGSLMDAAVDALSPLSPLGQPDSSTPLLRSATDGAASPASVEVAGLPSPVTLARATAIERQAVHQTRLLPPRAGMGLDLNSKFAALDFCAKQYSVAAVPALGQSASSLFSPGTYATTFPALGQCSPRSAAHSGSGDGPPPPLLSCAEQPLPSAGPSCSAGSPAPSSGVRPPFPAGTSSLKFSPPHPHSLTHHPVSLDAGSTIAIPSHISLLGVSSWACSLVGFFFGGKKSLHFVTYWAKRLWGDKLSNVFSYGNGYFIFSFRDPTDLQPLAAPGHAFFGNELIILQRWQASLNLTSPNFHSLPLWVKFRNVPLALWHEEGFAYLASHLGKPLYLDESTRSGNNLAYARVCVDIDVTTSIPSFFNVHVEGCDIQQVHIEVPWQPRKCLFCNIYGHSESKCSSKPQVLSPKPVVKKAKLAWQVVNPQRGSVLGISSSPSPCTAPPSFPKALPKGCTPKVLPDGSPERLSRAPDAFPRHPAGSPERLSSAQEGARGLAEGPTGSPEGFSRAPEAPRRQSEGTRRQSEGPPKGCPPTVLPAGSPERLSRAPDAFPRHPAGSPERLSSAQEGARGLAEGPSGSPEGFSRAPAAPRRLSEGPRRQSEGPPIGHGWLPKASRRLPDGSSSQAAPPIGGSSVAAPSGPLPLREMECCSTGGEVVFSSDSFRGPLNCVHPTGFQLVGSRQPLANSGPHVDALPLAPREVACCSENPFAVLAEVAEDLPSADELPAPHAQPSSLAEFESPAWKKVHFGKTDLLLEKVQHAKGEALSVISLPALKSCLKVRL